MHKSRIDISDLNCSSISRISPDNAQAIHFGTLKVLQQTGVFVESSKALRFLGDHGADINPSDNIARFPPNMVEEAIIAAPEKIVLSGRRPEDDIIVGGDDWAFVNFGAQIKVVDPDTGIIRSAEKTDVAKAARLCDRLNAVGGFSRAIHALDKPAPTMHLHTAEAFFANTSKPCFHGPEWGWQVKKLIAMADAAVGGETVNRKPITFVTAVTSPLTLNRKFCDITETVANANFPLGIASMVIGGGTGPVYPAGTLVQTNAEILAGIVLAQLIRKGTPVIYGHFSTSMDMKLGMAPLGSPEMAVIGAAAAGLCRYYKIPCLIPGMSSDGKRAGSQAAFEKGLTGMSAVMAGANILYGIGGLESGLTFDFGQAVLDNEMALMIRRFAEGMDVTEDTLSVDMIHQVGPQGNFIGHPDTYGQMRNLSSYELFDRKNRDTWETAGSPAGYEKALAKARHIIKTHTPFPLPDAAAETIREIIEETEREVREGKYTI